MTIITDEGVQRLQAALDHITLHPEEWDQSTWLRFFDENGESVISWARYQAGGCGTACCLAGRIVLDAGAEVTKYNDDYYYAPGAVPYLTDNHVLYRGELRVIPALATDLLTGERSAWGELDLLFDGDNTLSDLWEQAQALTGGRLTVPAEYQEDHDGNA